MIFMAEIVRCRIILFQQVTKIDYSSGSGENCSEGTGVNLLMKFSKKFSLENFDLFVSIHSDRPESDDSIIIISMDTKKFTRLTNIITM